MPRGGARVNSGPPPDPNALRRDRPKDKDGWTSLPAGGRKGRTPKWPLLADLSLTAEREFQQDTVDGIDGELTEAELGDDKQQIRQLRQSLQAARLKLFTLQSQIERQDAVEKQLWREAWKSPQSTAWERLGWYRDVAQYVRHKTLGEMGSIKDAQEARQWSDRLGLNPVAMLRLRWRITVDELAARREATPAPASPGSNMRDRVLKVVTPDGEE